jgi:RHS repeat-associated protein
MLGVLVLGSSKASAGGYVPFCGTSTCAKQVQQATSIAGVSASAYLPSFNNALLTDRNTIAAANNHLLKTPSSVDPVSTVTGNNYHDETDFTIAGRAGLNYVFTRTYNSAPSSSNVDRGMGYGWSHSYGMQLVSNQYGRYPNCDPVANATLCPENAIARTHSVTYTDERGGDHNYLVNDTSFAIARPAGEFDTLALDAPSAGLHTLTFRNGNRYVFQTVGSGNLKTTPGGRARLIRIADPWGNEINLTYDSSGRLWKVQDNLGIAGRTGLVFGYDAGNRVGSIADWTGRVWRYAVDAHGNLVSYKGPEPLATPGASNRVYTYAPGPNNEITHNLQSVEKPLLRNGLKVKTTFTYYQNGRTFSDSDGMGNTETLDYDLFRSVTRVTDPRGGVRHYHYDASGALLQLTQADGSIQKFQNSATDGLRYSKTDGLGHVTRYSYHTDNSFGTASNTGGNITLEQDALNNRIFTTYGPFDQVASSRDRRGNTTSTTFYSEAGTCAAIGKPHTVSIDKLTVNGVPKSNVVLKIYCWNADGTLRSQTERLNPDNAAHTRTTTYNYTTPAHLLVDNIVVSGWDGVSVTRGFGYDALGRKTSETIRRRSGPTDATPLALTTITAYDALDRVTLTVDAKGNRFTRRYDDNGQVWQETAEYKKVDQTFETRNAATRTFDASERVIAEIDDQRGIKTFEYDAAGNIAAVTDADGHTTRYEYDPLSRRTAAIDATGAATTTAYNMRGEVSSIADPLGETTRFEYDMAGRRTRVTDPRGYVTVNSYDENGNVVCAIDANAAAGLQPRNSDGCSTSTRYDELNRPVEVRDALGGITTTTYDLLGRPVARVDAEGRRYTWGYDGIGRLVSETDFTGKATLYELDEAGNIWRRTNRLGEIAETTFDVLNRKTQVKYLKEGAIETFAYDAAGNINRAANGTLSYTFQFDSLDRLLGKADSRGRSLRFTYSPAGNLLTKTTYSGATTTYTYDAANRLVNMSNPDYLSVNYQNDAAGRVLSRMLSSGARSLYSYESGGWLVGQKHVDAAGATIIEQSYTRDRIGNITAIGVTGAGTTRYTLDALYRLKTVAAPIAADSEAFSYDRLGNRLTATRGGTGIGASGSTTSYYIYYMAAPTGADRGAVPPSYNNRLKEVRTGSASGPIETTFVYDDEGRVIGQSGGAARSFTWDAKGRLISEGSETYAYDPLDHRVRRAGGTLGTLDYFLEGEHLESVYKNNKIQEKYFRGLSIDELVAGFTTQNDGLVPFFFQHDHVNSVVAVSKPNGGTQQRTSYRAFGEEQSGTGAHISRLKYTGREDDGTGLYQYRARYYDPRHGRFISEDPKRFDAGANFYAYVENNPINANDPSGLDTRITLGYTEVVPGFAYHQLVILTDTVTGQQFATRGGPEAESLGGSAVNSLAMRNGGSVSALSGNGNFGGFGFGPLVGQSNTFGVDFRDKPAAIVKYQELGVISRDFAESRANAIEYANTTNRHSISYWPLGPNSNSYASTFVESLTGTRPAPVLTAPGHSLGRPSAELSYRPSSSSAANYASKPSSDSLQKAYACP